MIATTVTRTTELWETSDSYELAETFTLTAALSEDAAVTAMKELMIKLTEQIDTWGSLLLDMACLKAAGRSNWQQPIAHLIPVLKRFGTDAQVEQALEEFAAENIPEFTGIESFEWGRVGGLYWEPTYWWGYLKQFHTPELQQAFWDKMQEFYEDWEPHPNLMEEFKTQVLQYIEESGVSTVVFDESLYPTWYADAWKAKGLAIEETLQQKQRGCTPVQVGMSREEYLSAYIEGLNGGADVTGVHSAIKILNMPELSERRLKLYIQQRLESPTSPVAQKLVDATEGEEVYWLVQSLFQSGKYNNVRLPEEAEEVKTEDVEQQLTPEELFEKCDGEANFEPLFADAARCEDVIMANIEAIAANYCEGNEFSANGEEPPWLLSALLKAGAEFG